ncbi:MAG: type II toxin-antitoxin system VapC family toxin [Gulosibacter sp.]|uniref:type II toxin-antitoxin system VapC family toxin n=1 Tax=Gulosibacter sp. TaxID=2817531 RepID=UPI003F8EAF65
MKYLLDTNILSDARQKRSTALMAWLHDQAVGDLGVSVITILELERGVRRKERRDSAGGRSLRLWLDEDVRPMFGDRILPVDERTAITAAALHIPNPLPEMDALIAATALVHGLTLVTRNTRVFQQIDVRLLSPWDS